MLNCCALQDKFCGELMVLFKFYCAAAGTGDGDVDSMKKNQFSHFVEQSGIVTSNKVWLVCLQVVEIVMNFLLSIPASVQSPPKNIGVSRVSTWPQTCNKAWTRALCSKATGSLHWCKATCTVFDVCIPSLPLSFILTLLNFQCRSNISSRQY